MHRRNGSSSSVDTADLMDHRQPPVSRPRALAMGRGPGADIKPQRSGLGWFRRKSSAVHSVSPFLDDAAISRDLNSPRGSRKYGSRVDEDDVAIQFDERDNLLKDGDDWPGGSFPRTSTMNQRLPGPSGSKRPRFRRKSSSREEDHVRNITGVSYSVDMEPPIDVSEPESHFTSNPSSRRSSRASSLKDVCYPVDTVSETGSIPGGRRQWPDIAYLTEFAQQEMHELEQEFPTNINTDGQESIAESTTYNRRDPSKAGPHLKSVNEADVSGRLRPHRFVPWHSMGKKARSVHDLHMFDDKDVSQYRFTFFSEDMDATIHSPNISGLLQSGYNLYDLFDPSNPLASKGIETSHQSQKLHQPQAQAPAFVHRNVASPIPRDDLDSSVFMRKKPSEQPSSSSRRPTPHLEQQQQHQQHQQEGASRTAHPAGEVSGSDHVATQVDLAPFWLDVQSPTEEEMKVLSKTFGIHPLTTEDIFLGESREKIELFRNYYFVNFRSFDVKSERAKSYGPLERHDKTANTSEGYTSTTTSNINNNNTSATAPLLTGGTSVDSSIRRHTLEEVKRRRRLRRSLGLELEPLNMYILVFHGGVITFHFGSMPHPINVRRRARVLKDYITVSSDWISYALIDDITDGFAPLIESIEEDVNSIEDEILRLHSPDSDSDSQDEEDWGKNAGIKLRTSKKDQASRGPGSLISAGSSKSSSSSSSSGFDNWREKRDMLRRIGECRKRVMSLLRLLGTKADVIKGLSKRCNEQWEVAPRSEIGLYLGDIQDHIVTMVQSLNHYEKLLARSHTNYLAQLNIDMTRVNNDMNDVLSQITVLGTIVLPMNIVTGLWGMNVPVPGQGSTGTRWFWMITLTLLLMASSFFLLARRFYNLKQRQG